MPDAGSLAAFRVAASVAVIGGAAGSIAFMLQAGRRQQSLILIFLFAMWVLSPFVALMAASLLSKSWPLILRVTLYGVMLVLTLGSLFIYGEVATGRMKAKAGFVFLVVPFASWVVTVVAMGTAALVSRWQSHQGTAFKRP